MALKKILNGSKPIRWPNGLSRFEVFMINKAKKNAKKYRELKEEFEGVKKEFEGIKQNNEGYAYYKNMTLTSDENGKFTATFKEEDRVYLNENNDEPEVLDKEKKTLKDKLFTPNTEITIDLYNLHGYIACVSDYIEKLNQIAEVIIFAGYSTVIYQDNYCYRSDFHGCIYKLKELFYGFDDFYDEIYNSFSPQWANYKFDNFEYAALFIKTDKDELDAANSRLNKLIDDHFDILLDLLKVKRTLIKKHFKKDDPFYSYIENGILYTDKFIDQSYKILELINYMKNCTRRSYMNLYKYGIKEEIKEEDTTIEDTTMG